MDFLFVVVTSALVAACLVTVGWQLMKLAELQGQRRRLVASQEVLDRSDLHQTITVLLSQYDSLGAESPAFIFRGFGRRVDRFEIVHELHGVTLALVYYRKGIVPVSGDKPYLFEVDFGPNAAAKGLQPQSYWVGAQGLQLHELAALARGVQLVL